MIEHSKSAIDDIATDAPVSHPKDDLLQRAEFAQQIADSILRVSAQEGFVIGLHGPWGSGKTSVMNLVRHCLSDAERNKKIIVTEFRPWWFSGQEQLIKQYFHHLWSVFKKKDVPKGLEKLGDAFECMGNFFENVAAVPMVPASTNWISKLFKAFAFVFSSTKRARQMDLDAWRDKAIALLQKQNGRILVIIDDIDRLTADEMRQMFQVVKAVGNFPNTIYLLSFDNTVVEIALNSVHEGFGREYLEKIVQVPFEVPQPDVDALHRLFFKLLDEVLRGTPDDLWMRSEWSGLFWDCIAPYLTSLRDIKRLINRLRVSYPLVVGEVNATEFVLFQTLQLFEPSLVGHIRDNWKDFAEPESLLALDRISDKERAVRAKTLLDTAGVSNRGAAEEALDRLFPRWKRGATEDGQTLHEWRTFRRIRHYEITRRYFMLQVPEGDISDAEMRDILADGGDVAKFTARLRKLVAEHTPSGVTRAHIFLEKVQDYTEKRIPHEHISSIVKALMVAGDDLLVESDRRGFLGSGNDILILRVVYQLLKRFKTQDERYRCLCDAITEGTSIYSIVHEIGVRGQEHGKFSNREKLRPEDDRSISAEQLSELEKAALDKIRSAAKSGTLAKVHRLGAVLFSWKEWAGADEPRQYATGLVQSDQGFVDLIVGCAGKTSSSSSQGYREWWTVNFDTISEFTGMTVDQAEARAKAIEENPPAWMSPMQREILYAFMAGVRKPKGSFGDPAEDDP